MHYIDNDAIYNELTISKKHVYIYTDSGIIKRFRATVKDSKLKFNNNSWTIINSDSSSLSVITHNNDTIRLYKETSIENELIHFYDWANVKHRNGNGYMILWRKATNRKMRLLEKIKVE